MLLENRSCFPLGTNVHLGKLSADAINTCTIVGILAALWSEMEQLSNFNVALCQAQLTLQVIQALRTLYSQTLCIFPKATNG